MLERAPMETAREKAEAAGGSDQDLNRQWWERLPMTYKAWGAEERGRLTAADFTALESEFLGANPWIAANIEFRAYKGKKVLEVGCGAGAASCLFAKAGADVVAVDLSEAAVRLTERNAAAQGVTLAVIRDDAEQMAIASNTVDFVFSWGVLHHSANTAHALRDIARVLKPNGTAVIMVYHRDSLRYYVRGLQWLLLRGKLRSGYRLETVQRFFTDGYYHRHFRRSEFRRILEQEGLSVRQMAVTHMGKRMVPRIPTKVDVWLKATFGWLMVASVEKSATDQGSLAPR